MTGERVVRASAPGKLVVVGEYAVLRGHEAVVAAVDVRATAVLAPEPALVVDFDEGGLLRACLDERAAAGPLPTGRLVVRTDAFRDPQDRKLGLGSSAAACVAMLRALAPGDDVAALHALAQRAHRRFQRGRGSGIDVAAATFGGFTRFRRLDPAHDAEVIAGPAPALPSALAIVPVWTGRSQDTRDFVGIVLAHAEVEALLDPLGTAARSFIAACAADDAAGVLAAVDDARQGLLQLGSRCSLDIVSAPHAHLADIARQYGGAAKPSGAGGGDIGLLFVERDRERDARRAVADAGLAPLSLVTGGDVAGARLDVVAPRARGEGQDGSARTALGERR